MSGMNDNNGKRPKPAYLADIENQGLNTIPEESPESLIRSDSLPENTPEYTSVENKIQDRSLKQNQRFSNKVFQFLTSPIKRLINFFSPKTKNSATATSRATVTDSSATSGTAGIKQNVTVKGVKSMAIPIDVKHFQDLISNFKAGFSIRPEDNIKKSTFLHITENNLNQIVKLHADAFDKGSIIEKFKKFNNEQEKIAFIKSLSDLLLTYRLIILNTEFNHQEEAVKEEAETLVKVQLKLLSDLESMRRPTQALDDVQIAKYFKQLTVTLAEVTKKEYTNILRKFLTAPNKLTAKVTGLTKTPILPSLDPIPLLAATKFDLIADPMPKDSTSEEAMKRIMKNSAKAKFGSDAKHKLANTMASDNYGDFSNEVEVGALFTKLQELANVAAGSKKTSNANYSTALQTLHDKNKVDVYKTATENKFTIELSNTTKNELLAKFKDSSLIALKVTVVPNAKNNKLIQKATITVPGEFNHRYDIQAYTTDYLRKEAKLLGAKSVSITSVNADGTVNIENILKGAFNALNSHLVPRFDVATWKTLQTYVRNAREYTKHPVINETMDTYTERCTSKQFVDFLLNTAQPSAASKLTFTEIHDEFTDLADILDYAAVYTTKRRKS